MALDYEINLFVIPAKAGIQGLPYHTGFPVKLGMTQKKRGAA